MLSFATRVSLLSLLVHYVHHILKDSLSRNNNINDSGNILQVNLVHCMYTSILRLLRIVYNKNKDNVIALWKRSIF